MRRAALVAVLSAVALAGCGGSHPHATAQPKIAAVSPAPSTACQGDQYIMQCAGTQTAAQLPGATLSSLFGVDFEGAPSPTLLRSDGVRFAVSYLSGVPGKDWTRAELGAYHAAGVLTAVVFERGAGDASNGCGEGLIDARAALAEADALGVPRTVGIPLAVDEDVSGASVEPYFACAHRILGARLGAYGSYRVITYLNAHGLTRCTTDYQTVAWSGGQWSCAGIEQPSINNTLRGLPAGKVDFDRTHGASTLTWPQAKPKPSQHYGRYPSTRWTLFHQHVRERNTVRAWDRAKCRRPARRTVCRTSAYHLRLALGRDRHVYERSSRAKRERYHLPGRIQGLVHRLTGTGQVTHWL